MLLARFFHYLQHLYLKLLRQVAKNTKTQQLLIRFIRIAEKVLIVLWKTFLVILKALFNEVIRFFNFFRHFTWGTLKEVFNRAAEQRLHGLSSEMAFHATLALFPGLLAVFSAIGMFESLQETLYQMARLLAEFVPNEVRIIISNLLQQIFNDQHDGGIFSLSFIVSLWIFSGVLGAAMAALDQIHRIPSSEARPFWKAKLVSLGLAIGTLVLLIIASTLVLISDQIVHILAARSCLLETIPNCPLDKFWNCLLEDPVRSCMIKIRMLAVWKQWKWPITLGVVSTAFAFVYRFGPSHWQKGTPIMPGAVIAAGLWALISSLFRLYVSHFSNYNLTYGTIGTFVILLLWLYLSSLTMLIGAQLNVTVGKEMQSQKRSHIIPNPDSLSPFSEQARGKRKSGNR